MKNHSSHARKKNKSRSAPIGIQRLLLSCTYGTLVGVAVLAVMLGAMSAVVIFMPNPHKFMLPLAAFSLATSAFFTGFASVKFNGGDVLMCGGLSGVMLALLLELSFVLLRFGNGISPIVLTVPLVCVLGGFSSVGKGKAKRKRKF